MEHAELEVVNVSDHRDRIHTAEAVQLFLRSEKIVEIRPFRGKQYFANAYPAEKILYRSTVLA
jgi:hypothetical protein